MTHRVGNAYVRFHAGSRSGFSLIELLVVIAIMVLMTNVSLVGYNRFQERQAVKSAALQLATDLRLTQQKALSGEKPSGWCSAVSDHLRGWRLAFNSATTYQLIGVCDSGTTTIDRTVTLPNSVAGPSGASTEFLALTGASREAVEFLLERTISSGTVSFRVQVNKAGAVGVQ